jgi:hypothetical protein
MQLDQYLPRTLAALLLCVCACAQAAPTHLRGQVTSHLTGLPLYYASVDILAADGSYIGYAGADAGGAYAWSGNCPDSGSTCITPQSHVRTASARSPSVRRSTPPSAAMSAVSISPCIRAS